MGICKLCDNGYWDVDGKAIYVPTSVVIENDNIVSSDSGRVESGKMYINWVRRTVRKVKLIYEKITGLEVAYMHNLMQGREFTFHYFDAGAVQEMAAYAGKDSYTQSNLSVYPDEGGLYRDFTIDIIEM